MSLKSSVCFNLLNYVTLHLPHKHLSYTEAQSAESFWSYMLPLTCSWLLSCNCNSVCDKGDKSMPIVGNILGDYHEVSPISDAVIFIPPCKSFITTLWILAAKVAAVNASFCIVTAFFNSLSEEDVMLNHLQHALYSALTKASRHRNHCLTISFYFSSTMKTPRQFSES